MKKKIVDSLGNGRYGNQIKYKKNLPHYWKKFLKLLIDLSKFRDIILSPWPYMQTQFDNQLQVIDITFTLSLMNYSHVFPLSSIYCNDKLILTSES